MTYYYLLLEWLDCRLRTGKRQCANEKGDGLVCIRRVDHWGQHMGHNFFNDELWTGGKDYV